MLPEIPKVAFDVTNVAIFAVILLGVAWRRRRARHVAIMRSCFVADLLMVLVIELQRGAVQQTIEQAQTLSKGLLSFHIAVSVAALVMWIVQLKSGSRILHGGPLGPGHRRGAALFLFFRFTNVVTAFMV
jgi:hypothetical protein